MEREQDSEGRRGQTPPYISLQSLKTLVGDFKQHGVPGRIDRTVLTRFSGGVGGQIITALRFLHLIGDDSRPTVDMRELVDAFGTETWAIVLARVVRNAYQPVFALDLQTATPGQFQETFRKAYPAKEETFRKCVTFFLSAAREAQIPVSAYLLKGTKPRTTPSRRPRASASRANNGSRTDDGAEAGDADDTPPPQNRNQTDNPPGAQDSTGGKTQAQVLLDMLNPAKMDENEIKAVWTLILYLKKSES